MSSSSNITEEQMKALTTKLESLLPEDRRRALPEASPAKLLDETCKYIKSLRAEVGGLSERLTELISANNIDEAQAEQIRKILGEVGGDE